MYQVLACLVMGAAALEAQNLARMDTVAGRFEPSGLSEQTQNEALLYTPTKAIPDGSGGYYVAEPFHYRVRRMRADGTVKTVLGTGVPGSPVDGAKGDSTPVTNPWDLALDSTGNLFAVSEAGCTVVRLNTEGIVKIVAGGGTCGYAGDNDDALKASLSAPVAVAVDAGGRVYIADRNNHRIRRVDTDGRIRTIAGTGQNLAAAANTTDPLATHVPSPRGLVIDKAGNLYFTDGARRVRRLAPNGAITTLAGDGSSGIGGNGGPATAASFRFPEWLAVDEERSLLYVSDSLANQVRVIDLRAGSIRHFAGIAPASQFQSSAASSFSGDGAQANAAGLASPAGLSVDPDGSVLIADRENDRIRRVSPAGVIRTLLGRFRNQAANADAEAVEFRSIVDLASTPAGILVLDSGTDVVGRIDNAGKFQVVAGIAQDKRTGRERRPDFELRFESDATAILLGDTLAMDVDASGDVYLLTTEGVLRIRAGRVRPLFSLGRAADCTDIAADMGRQRLLLACRGEHLVLSVNPDVSPIVSRFFAGFVQNGLSGESGFSGDSGPANRARLSSPSRVTVDKAGNVYVFDSGNGRIRKVDADGMIQTIAGNGSLLTESAFRPDAPPASPIGIVQDLRVDPEGNLYFSEFFSVDLVRKLDVASNRLQVGAGIPGVRGFGPSPALVGRSPIFGAGAIAFGVGNRVYFSESRRIRAIGPVRSARLEIQSGDKQSAAASTTLTDPLSVRVRIDGDPLAGVEVEFRVLSGEAVLKTAKVVTDAEGIAATGVTLGEAEGPVSIAALVPGFPSATFTVTATAPLPPPDLE